MLYTNLAHPSKCGPSRRRLACGLLSVCVTLLSGASALADDHEISRVRSADASILNLIREGSNRSQIFRRLLDTIERTNGIVYVEFGHCAFGHLDGCLLPFMDASGGQRYLRVVVTPDTTKRQGDQLIALIAHELQHAIEVLQHTGVASVDAMLESYRRLGAPGLVGRSGYETSAARAAGDTVLAELRRSSREKRVEAPR